MVEPLTRILVPVDFSPVTKPLVDLAASISSQYSSEIVLMHVIEESIVDHVSAGYNVTLLVESLVEESKKKLEELSAYALEKGAARVSVYQEIPIADPAPAIAGVASEVRASEILVASKGWGLSRLFSLGSTGRLVVKLSPVPVIFVKAMKENDAVKLLLRDGKLFGTLLYAIKHDYTMPSLEYLMKLASLTKSRVTIIHIPESGSTEFLSDVERRLSYSAIEVEVVEVKGRAHDAILRYARAIGANAIYLERRVHQGPRSIFLGSVLDRVLNAAEVPVIVHPAAGEQRK